MAKKEVPHAAPRFHIRGKLNRLPVIGWMINQYRNNKKRHTFYTCSGILLVVAMPILEVNILLSLPFILVGTVMTVIHGFKLLFELKLSHKILAQPNQNATYSHRSRDFNLERLRTLFLRMGFVITLLLLILAFNWKVYEQQPSLHSTLPISDEIDNEPPLTRFEKKPPPPPVKDAVKKLVPTKKEDVITEPPPEIDHSIPFDDPLVKVPDEQTTDDHNLFSPHGQEPEFPGGEEAMYEFIHDNIKPPVATRDIEGLVVVRFMVRADGSVGDIKIVKDIGGGYGKAVKRVIKSMPRWTPGKQRGKPVSVHYTLPFRFKVQ